MTSSSYLPSSRTGLVSLLLIFISLIGRCQAQTNFVITIVPIILIVSVILCFCCCVCVACLCNAKQRRSNATKLPSETTAQTINHPEQAPYHSQPPYVHNQLQDYVPPSTRVLYPPQEEQDSSQNVATAPPEPVPLPDATLHEGDAPPGYEEALRMTTCNEPEQ